MSELDFPLKLLVRETIADLAGWLLGQEIVRAEELNVELTTESPRVDMVFRLSLTDHRVCLFHLEFQGRSSRPPMPRRQLNHLTRLALQQEWPIALESFVLYTESYAGSKDLGHHEVTRLDGTPALQWHYTPLHLWKVPAESLLNLNRRGIIPLISLMQIQDPETTLHQAVARIEEEPDEERRSLLLTSFITLMSDQEHFAMLESILDNAIAEEDRWLWERPYMRKVRAKLLAEVREEVEEIHKRDLLESHAEGQAEGFKNSILQLIVKRFDPPARLYLQVEKALEPVSDLTQLEEWHAAAIDASSIEAYLASLKTG
jgi:hypothetical protein